MEKEAKTVEISIPSELGYEKVAMKTGEALAELLGFQDERIEDLKTAISEAVLNAIEHGNKFNKKLSVLVLMTAKEGRLEVEVHDKGKGIKRVSKKTPDINKKIEGKETPRGLGMFLIENLVDEVEVFSDSSEGSYIRMVIHLEAKK